LHRPLRRLAALLIVTAPVVLLGRAGATWGASPAPAPQPQLPRHQAGTFETSPLAVERGDGERAESAVVLVVLDGVRAQELFGGADARLAREHGLDSRPWASPRELTPNLHRMLDTDAVAIGAPGHGAEIAASGPRFISLPGYLEIFAGRPDPGCEGNNCDRPPARTIADDVRESSGAGDFAMVTSWPNIARAAAADLSPYVATAGRKIVAREGELRSDLALASLLDRGAGVKAWPGEGDYRPDAYTARVALRVLETQRPRLMFVGLGDADEYAHRGDYRGYLQALHASDGFLGDLAATLSRMGARGRHTTVLVTADHGRAKSFNDHGARYPESARVWLVAQGGDVRGHGLVAAARRHTLSDVAPTVRALLGIAGEGTPIGEIVDLAGAREPGAAAAVGPEWRDP
jgi:hypothetical protein